MKYLVSLLVLFALLMYGCATSRLSTGYDRNESSASTSSKTPKTRPDSGPPAERADSTKAVAVKASFHDSLFPDML
ncbi:MAG TPA: hypothetical protein VK463_15635 [Desulfomonilaceae bacterium]|nr:hypothetical protein [Desulfomonilaceae bacterium]